jgi:hypothetical protein
VSSATFTLGDVSYGLIGLDEIKDMTLGELEILETQGGLDLNQLDDVPVTVRLVVALVHVSMLRTNPDAEYADAKLVKVSVLEQLSEVVANSTSDDADPPTEQEPEHDGALVSASGSGSSPGSLSGSPSESGA